MTNPVVTLERRLSGSISVPFFFRTMLYAFFIIYCFFIVPIASDSAVPRFPNVLWVVSNLIFLLVLWAMSQANYPNHIREKEANQRLLAVLLPPSLLLLGSKQRWRDLQILIKRDQYGSYLLIIVLAGAFTTTVLYGLVLLELLLDEGILSLIYVWGYSLMLYLPIYLLDRYIIATAGEIQTAGDQNWETVSVTAEPRYFNIPAIILFFRSKRRRFWTLLLLVLIYYNILVRPEIRVAIY